MVALLVILAATGLAGCFLTVGRLDVSRERSRNQGRRALSRVSARRLAFSDIADA